MKCIVFSCILLMLAIVVNAQQKDTYSKTELDAILTLQEHKIEARINELNLKEDNLELSKQNVADIISFHKEGLEEFHRTLNYILVLAGILVSIAIGLGGYILGRYNKQKSVELKKEINLHQASVQVSLTAIQEEANRELNLIRAEAKKQLSELSATKKA